MGCGSSSLKGDQPADVGGGAPNIKKVATNFTDIDYDAASKGRKEDTFAPHESNRPSTNIDQDAARSSAEGPHHTAAKNARAEMMGDTTQPEGDKLAPYKSVGTAEDAFHDPTSDASKARSAARDEPVNHQVSSSNQKPSMGTVSSNQDPNSNKTSASAEKKGWYQRYTDKKVGRTHPISDADLEKYTGMTRVEHDKFKADPTNQVAGNQNPLRVTGSAAGGFGGISAAEGTMGWGYGDEQKRGTPEITQ